jgi:hypothetical protein
MSKSVYQKQTEFQLIQSNSDPYYLDQNDFELCNLNRTEFQIRPRLISSIDITKNGIQ